MDTSQTHMTVVVDQEELFFKVLPCLHTFGHDTAKCSVYSLYWLLSRVDHPVHSQVMGALEGSSTILTDVVPLI